MLRPWLEGNLAGCPGLSSWLLVSLKGGWGYLYSTPGPGSQPKAACHSRGRASFQPQEECVWKCAFAMVGRGMRTLGGKKKKKDTTFDCFLPRFPRLFSTVPFLMPGRNNQAESTGLGFCGVEEVQGLAERKRGWSKSYLHLTGICICLAWLC